MAHVEALDHVLHALAHRGRAPSDHIAVVEKLLPRDLAQVVERDRLVLVEGAFLDRVDRPVARRVGEAHVHVETAVEEVADVLLVELLGLLVGLAHTHDLGECAAVGRLVLAERRDAVPVAVHQRLAAQVAGEREVGVVVVVLGAEVPGLDRAAAGDVDRRVRLLDRLGPAVHVAELVVLAVEGEGLVLRPGPHDEVVGLEVLVAGERRDLAVAEVGVHRRADREAGHQAPAGDHVEHRELLGHADRRVVERDRVADHADGRLAGAARQGSGNQIWRGHHPVAVLMMLVDRDRVEAQRFGVLELVHIVVVDVVTAGRLVDGVRDIDPHRAVLGPEVFVQVGPGHQVEPGEFHVVLPASGWSGWCGR